MVFITHAWKSGSRHLRLRRLQLVIGCLAVLIAPPAWGGEFEVEHVTTRLVGGVYLLDAEIEYELGPTALAALSKGVPLTIRLDITVERLRRWIWNEEVASLEQRYELSYHAFSRQYLVRNLNSGGVYTHPMLASALETIGELRGFPLIDKKLVEGAESYRGALRAYLDIEALPSPLRPIAYISPSWHLESDRHLWSLTR